MRDSVVRYRPSFGDLSQPAPVALLLVAALYILGADAVAQSPWERAAVNLETSFTGPLARSLALVAIVLGGLVLELRVDPASYWLYTNTPVDNARVRSAVDQHGLEAALTRLAGTSREDSRP